MMKKPFLRRGLWIETVPNAGASTAPGIMGTRFAKNLGGYGAHTLDEADGPVPLGRPPFPPPGLQRAG